MRLSCLNKSKFFCAGYEVVLCYRNYENVKPNKIHENFPFYLPEIRNEIKSLVFCFGDSNCDIWEYLNENIFVIEYTHLVSYHWLYHISKLWTMSTLDCAHNGGYMKLQGNLISRNFIENFLLKICSQWTSKNFFHNTTRTQKSFI